jgi:hypothetical protein
MKFDQLIVELTSADQSPDRNFNSKTQIPVNPTYKEEPQKREKNIPYKGLLKDIDIIKSIANRCHINDREVLMKVASNLEAFHGQITVGNY